MKKKNILLVCDVHLHIAMEYFKLLSDQHKVDIYWSIKHKKNVNSFLKQKTKFFTYPEGLIYFFLILKSFKYDYVFLATGPQGFNRFKGLIGVFGYLIFVFFHGKKTIMGIRDNNKYFRNNDENFVEKILNFIRNMSLSKILCVFFETKTLMRNFKKKIDIKNINCLTIYPLHFVSKKIKVMKSSSKIIKIGILGSIKDKNNRRDFDILSKAINLLNKKSQNKITLIFLGKVESGNKNREIQELQKKIKSKIVYKNGYIKEIEFKKLCSSCHVLLSINKKGYGNSHKGTGSFFDAISSKKRLITNYRTDTQFEFKNFCYYYSNAIQLSKILKLFLADNNKFRPLNRNIFNKYNNNQAKNELMKWLC